MNTKSFETQHNSKLKDCSWTKVQSTLRIKNSKTSQTSSKQRTKNTYSSSIKVLPPKQELSIATVALLGKKVQRVASFFSQNGGPLFLSHQHYDQNIFPVEC